MTYPRVFRAVRENDHWPLVVWLDQFHAVYIGQDGTREPARASVQGAEEVVRQGIWDELFPQQSPAGGTQEEKE
jgi:hypothetical protein